MPAQIEAIRKVYAGVRNPRTGQLIFRGWSKGSEGFGPGGQGWGSLVNGREPRRGEFFKYFVFHDPNWDFRTFDFDKDTAYTDKVAGHISAVDPDMSAFQARGGKLIMYAGWADPILPAEDVIDYYDDVRKTMGARKVEDLMRFYMVPGMGHCSGGPGTANFDMLAPLTKWVEGREAPKTVTASRIDKGAVVRTRPLCPYPQAAKWTGKGSSDDAANFVCK
jgi:feruloyl esterase